MAGKNKAHRAADTARENVYVACRYMQEHSLFAPLYMHARIIREEHNNLCPSEGWGVVTSDGEIHLHPTRRGETEEWIYILSHCFLHLAFDHFRTRPRAREWNAACDCFVASFLAGLKFGRPPEEQRFLAELPGRTEERIYEFFCEYGIPEHLQYFSTAGAKHADMVFEVPRARFRQATNDDWAGYFAVGLRQAVASAVNVAGGLSGVDRHGHHTPTVARRARDWFISSYPLLGALAAAFEIVEDPSVCHRLEISVAAVCFESETIYISPAAALNKHQARFVIAHELLHVGLRHDVRRQGRDPYLWNVACDYVINGWLVEMGIGELPNMGCLYDPDLKGLSAEAVYDLVVTDLRRFRKLATLRGVAACDMIERQPPEWWTRADGVNLDQFYRNCLSQGLVYHELGGRGFLPAGLIEEIRALYEAPLPWDVELARWFDGFLCPFEKRRSYARISRRQSATPDIPRPRWEAAHGTDDGRTYGVVLDTSGSMDREKLARALGAIASYSIARDVPLVRVVFCDAAPYDQGYLAPEAICHQVRVKVKGRGGTVLQPAIDLLQAAEDFPPDGPLLIITDGSCDRLHLHRKHAFLMPQGRSLPFVPKGPIFRFS